MTKRVLSFADHLSSSATTFLLLVYSLKFCSDSDLTRIAVVLSIYALIIALNQSIFGEAILLLRRKDNFVLQNEISFYLIIKISLFLSIFGAIIIWTFGIPFQVCCLIVLCFFALLIQDMCRYVALVNNDISKLFASDLFWLICSVIYFILLRPTNLVNVFLGWAIPGVLANIFFFGIVRLSPKERGESYFVQLKNSKLYLLFLETISGSISGLVVMYGIVVFLGVEWIAVLRLSQSVFGFVNLVINSFRILSTRYLEQSLKEINVLLINLIKRLLSLTLSIAFTLGMLQLLEVNLLSFFSSKTTFLQLMSLIGYAAFERYAIGFNMIISVFQRLSGEIRFNTLLRIAIPIFSAILSVIAFGLDFGLHYYFIISGIFYLSGAFVIMSRINR